MNTMPTHVRRLSAILLFAFVSLFLFWLKTIDGGRPALDPLILQFEARSSGAAPGRLIIDNQFAVNVQVPPSASFQTVSIPVQEGTEPMTTLRFDPLIQPGAMEVRSMRFIRGGMVIADVAFDNLESLNPQATILRTDDGFSFRHTSNADFPAIGFKGIFPLDTPLVNSATFGRGALAACWLLGLALAVALIQGMVRSVRGAGAAGLFIGGVFLVVFGLRLVTLQFYGDRVPNWDYWQMPWTVYLPFMDGNMTWQGMIAPINEHRIFFARLFSLGLFILNGQWENLYEATAMSGLHALTASGLALLLWNALGRKHALFVFLLVAGAMGLPFTWENIIWANQSQFYFFVGFSILTIWLLGMHRPLSARWWLGCSAAMAAQFTVGSGMLAPIVVVGLSVYRLMRDAGGRKDAGITLGASLALTAFASMFRIKSQSFGMMTKTADQFIQTFGKTMSWPFTESVWIWILLWLPFLVFVVRALFARTPWTKAEAWTFALGGWVILNALGVALFRGGFSGGPASRYMDLTAVGMIANGLAVILLPGVLTKGGRFARFMAWFRPAWGIAMLAGVLWITSYELSYPAAVRVEHQRKSIENVRAFMQSGDLQALAAKKHYEIPHPDPMRLAAWLRSDKMRAILPVSIRDPLPLEPESMIGFTSPGLYGAYDFDIREPTWGSYGREGDRTTGSFVGKPMPASRYAYLCVPALNRLYDGQKSITLRFVDRESGKGYRASAGKDTSGGWMPIYARVPKKPLVLEAVDNDMVFWIAFRAPRELSFLSFWSFRLIAAGPLVLGAGLVLLYFALTGCRQEPGRGA